MRTPPHTPPSTPPSSSSSSSAARPGPACAACKHQRRRCSADCPLAPYFPADKQREFHNVHRLFGINNVVKLLKNTPPEHRDDAVTSLVHEAHFRASDPVGGAYAVVRELLRRLELCRAELSVLSDQLALHRSRSMQNFKAKPLNFRNRESEFLGINQEFDFNSEMVGRFLNDRPFFPED